MAYRYSGDILRQISTPPRLELPNPAQTLRTGLDLQNAVQSVQAGNLQLRQSQQAQFDEQVKRQSAAKLNAILTRHGGDIDKALPDIAKEVPEYYLTYADVSRKIKQENTAYENAKLTQQKTAQDIKFGQAEESRKVKDQQQQETDAAAKLAQETAGVLIPGTEFFAPPTAQGGKPVRSARYRVRMPDGSYREETRGLGEAVAAPSTTPQRNQTVTTEEGVFILNPDGTLGTRLGSRPRPTANVELAQLRDLDIENKTQSSPGQVVFKNSGRPVGQQMPETAATRLEGLQTAIEQADIVEQALINLGTSGAVKGYIEEKGMFWPVIQDRLTPEQVEAVSETNRLLSAYAQAVSGLAVSDAEIARLQKSAPSVRLTPEANRKIVGHFRRNAIAKRDNYLDLRGWKIKEDTPEAPPSSANPLEFDGFVFPTRAALNEYKRQTGQQ